MYTNMVMIFSPSNPHQSAAIDTVIQDYDRPFHPMGISAAAISETPRSVANRLNCAAAFRVS